MSVKTSIVVDGVEYAGVDQMPPGVRSQYEKLAPTDPPTDLPGGASTASTSVARWVVSGGRRGPLDDSSAAFRKPVRSGDRPAATPSASLDVPGAEEPKSSLGSLVIGLLVALLALIAFQIVF